MDPYFDESRAARGESPGSDEGQRDSDVVPPNSDKARA
jgi:hypothetical protein